MISFRFKTAKLLKFVDIRAINRESTQLAMDAFSQYCGFFYGRNKAANSVNLRVYKPLCHLPL